MSFDYGEELVSAGSKFKQAAVGKHAARLRSIVHMGMVVDVFDGKPKPPAPFVYAIFELKEESDKNEDGTPIDMGKDFPLRSGDKAFLTKFMRAMLTDEERKAYDAGTLTGGLDMLIGRVCELDIAGSKDKNEDGSPKYVHIAGISSLHPKLAAITDELEVKGVGHVKFQQLTKAAVEEIPPYLVSAKMMTGITYVGSPAESAVAEILKDKPDAFTKKGKDGKPESQAPANAAQEAPDAKAPELDADEEY